MIRGLLPSIYANISNPPSVRSGVAQDLVIFFFPRFKRGSEEPIEVRRSKSSSFVRRQAFFLEMMTLGFPPPSSVDMEYSP